MYCNYRTLICIVSGAAGPGEAEKGAAYDAALGNLRALGAYAADVVEALGEAAGGLVAPQDAALLDALAAALRALRAGDVPDLAIDAAVRGEVSRD